MRDQGPCQGKWTKSKLQKFSQPGEWSIIPLRCFHQADSIGSLCLNKGSYSDWRHDSCCVAMSLILFLCNESIIFYNLGQPEGPAIKYSRWMSRGLMYVMSWPAEGRKRTEFTALWLTLFSHCIAGWIGSRRIIITGFLRAYYPGCCRSGIVLERGSEESPVASCGARKERALARK